MKTYKNHDIDAKKDEMRGGKVNIMDNYLLGINYQCAFLIMFEAAKWYKKLFNIEHNLYLKIYALLIRDLKFKFYGWPTE